MKITPGMQDVLQAINMYIPTCFKNSEATQKHIRWSRPITYVQA